MNPVFGGIIDVMLTEIGKMWWFTVLGVVIAALIKTFQWDRKVRIYVGKFGVWAIPVAVLVGMLSPLCSCGVLPIIIPMAISGVPLPPLMALLTTSPIMDPSSFFLTYGALGAELAWWKFGGALFLGLLAGYVTHFFVKIGYFSGNIVRIRPVYNENGELASAYEIGCANGIILRTMKIVPRESKFRFFVDRFLDVGLFVFPLVLFAVFIEAVMQVMVPVNALAWLTGASGPVSIVLSAVAALLLPLHQIPIVPILAGLKAKGLGVGPDIAFLMAGPVSSIPSMVALWGIFFPRVVVVFLGVGLFGSMLLGLARMLAG